MGLSKGNASASAPRVSANAAGNPPARIGDVGYARHCDSLAMTGAARYLSERLIAASAFEPGQSSASVNSFNGRAVVPSASCSSSTSLSR